MTTHLLYTLGYEIRAFTVDESRSQLPLDVVQYSTLIVERDDTQDMNIVIHKDIFDFFKQKGHHVSTVAEIQAYIEAKRTRYETRHTPKDQAP